MFRGYFLDNGKNGLDVLGCGGLLEGEIREYFLEEVGLELGRNLKGREEEVVFGGRYCVYKI